LCIDITLGHEYHHPHSAPPHCSAALRRGPCYAPRPVGAIEKRRVASHPPEPVGVVAAPGTTLPPPLTLTAPHYSLSQTPSAPEEFTRPHPARPPSVQRASGRQRPPAAASGTRGVGRAPRGQLFRPPYPRRRRDAASQRASLCVSCATSLNRVQLKAVASSWASSWQPFARAGGGRLLASFLLRRDHAPTRRVARPPLLPDAQFKRWPWGGCFLAFRTIVMRPSSLDPPSAQTTRAPQPAAAASCALVT